MIKGFYLARSWHSGTQLGRQISRLECVAIRRDLRKIKQFEEILNPYLTWTFANARFRSATAEIMKQLENPETFHFSNFTRLYCQITQEVSAILFAFRQFSDVYLYTLPKVYPAILAGSFKAHTRSLYDSAFEYRFCSRLRNYAQHMQLPLHHIEATYRPHADPFLTEHSIALDRDKLLQVDVWGPMRSELQARESKIQLFPQLESLQQFCLQLYGIVLNYCRHAHWPEISRVYELLKELPEGDSPASVTYIALSVDESGRGRQFLLPENFIRVMVEGPHTTRNNG